jgi:hypothetical protein
LLQVHELRQHEWVQLKLSCVIDEE